MGGRSNPLPDPLRLGVPNGDWLFEGVSKSTGVGGVAVEVGGYPLGGPNCPESGLLLELLFGGNCWLIWGLPEGG